jgi:hypothetical protein
MPWCVLSLSLCRVCLTSLGSLLGSELGSLSLLGSGLFSLRGCFLHTQHVLLRVPAQHTRSTQWLSLTHSTPARSSLLRLTLAHSGPVHSCSLLLMPRTEIAGQGVQAKGGEWRSLAGLDRQLIEAKDSSTGHLDWADDDRLAKPLLTSPHRPSRPAHAHRPSRKGLQ